MQCLAGHVHVRRILRGTPLRPSLRNKDGKSYVPVISPYPSNRNTAMQALLLGSRNRSPRTCSFTRSSIKLLNETVQSIPKCFSNPIFVFILYCNLNVNRMREWLHFTLTLIYWHECEALKLPILSCIFFHK